MILVDSAVWVAHLRAHDSELARVIDADAVYTHPYVVGELSLGSFRQLGIVVKSLQDLPRVTVAADAEVLQFLSRHALFGRGIGYVDVCLLAAASITPNTWLWTHDKKLAAIATDLGLAASPPFPARTLG